MALPAVRSIWGKSVYFPHFCPVSHRKTGLHAMDFSATLSIDLHMGHNRNFLNKNKFTNTKKGSCLHFCFSYVAVVYVLPS